MPAGLNLAGKALTPGAQRSWWLREALAAEDDRSCPPLTEDVKADVVIVGGGFTGLWTGQVLADLVTGADTDATRLPMVNRKPRLFPPEPFRSIGAAVVRRAIIAKDTAEERGVRPNPLAAAIVRMPRRMGFLLGP